MAIKVQDPELDEINLSNPPTKELERKIKEVSPKVNLKLELKRYKKLFVELYRKEKSEY